jgi:hypothetical protein
MRYLHMSQTLPTPSHMPLAWHSATEVVTSILRWQLKTSECHSKRGGGNELTNQNPPLALPTPSHIPLTWHSGTEVVTTGVLEHQPNVRSSTLLFLFPKVRLFELEYSDWGRSLRIKYMNLWRKLWGDMLGREMITENQKMIKLWQILMMQNWEENWKV